MDNIDNIVSEANPNNQTKKFDKLEFDVKNVYEIQRNAYSC